MAVGGGLSCIKQLIMQRLKGLGMRWNNDRGQALLHACSAYLSAYFAVAWVLMCQATQGDRLQWLPARVEFIGTPSRQVEVRDLRTCPSERRLPLYGERLPSDRR